MMPVIRVSDPIFGRLQRIATPFVDTPASVIQRLLDFYESRSKPKEHEDHEDHMSFVGAGSGDFDCYDPPDLTHTRVLKADIAGEKAESWNELVHAAHRQAIQRLGDFEALRSNSLSNIVKGRRSDSGFHFSSGADISIQNVEANMAWRNAFHLAKRCNLNLSVDFEWMDKDGASMRGKQGRLCWPPTKPKAV